MLNQIHVLVIIIKTSCITRDVNCSIIPILITSKKIRMVGMPGMLGMGE